ncbi:hypothetical protein Rctr71_082 [Virus Rctr71]|nr:hypothetical protein Rctr71_082 [Virus Rctr71]
MSAFAIAGATPSESQRPDLSFPPVLRRDRVTGLSVNNATLATSVPRYAVVGRQRITAADAKWYYDRLGARTGIVLYDPDVAAWVTVTGKIDSPVFDYAMPDSVATLVNFRVTITVDP